MTTITETISSPPILHLKKRISLETILEKMRASGLFSKEDLNQWFLLFNQEVSLLKRQTFLASLIYDFIRPLLSHLEEEQQALLIDFEEEVTQCLKELSPELNIEKFLEEYERYEDEFSVNHALEESLAIAVTEGREESVNQRIQQIMRTFRPEAEALFNHVDTLGEEVERQLRELQEREPSLHRLIEDLTRLHTEEKQLLERCSHEIKKCDLGK